MTRTICQIGISALLTASFAILCSCDESKSRGKPSSERQISDSNADMFYKISVDLVYNGSNLNLSQLVRCHVRTVSGGSLGQTTDLASRKISPQSVGISLKDGGFIALKIPDLCLINRAYKAGKPRSPSTRTAEWASTGPYNIFPLLIWADSEKNPSIIEEYLSPSYYGTTSSKINIIDSHVIFIPSNANVQKTEMAGVEKDPLADDVIKVGKFQTARKLGLGFVAYAALPKGDPVSNDTPNSINTSSRSAAAIVKRCIEKMQYGNSEISDIPAEFDIGYRPIQITFGKVRLNIRPQADRIYKENTLMPSGPAAFVKCAQLLPKIISFRFVQGSSTVGELSDLGILRFYPENNRVPKPEFKVEGSNAKLYDSISVAGSAYSISKISNIVRDPYVGE
ncbi:hypothetical protein WG908_16265 [Sphingobium sp. AN641]|uniref:hypothetical protein n=1 Tax=Sphingobium sp. AN641 TaxID=3133443 RepID=UPI0030C5CFD5